MMWCFGQIGIAVNAAELMVSQASFVVSLSLVLIIGLNNKPDHSFISGGIIAIILNLLRAFSHLY